MKHRSVVLFAIVALAVSPALWAQFSPTDLLAQDVSPEAEPVAAPPDCPDNAWRTARLICADGAAGSVAGVYGGVPFFVFCDSGVGETSFCTSGTSYGARVGQNHPRAVDCAYFGDSVAVAERCDRLHLVIAGSPGN
jgi:hypothetical protein